MKLIDGPHGFDNVGDNPLHWDADVVGGTLISTEYGTLVWDDDQKCYINDGPPERRLFIFDPDLFCLITLPVGMGVEVGHWT